jgi:4-amino-4-deoxy-L-arabinose transferase-like glycosyltransferase
MITQVDRLTAVLIAGLVTVITIAASTRQGIARDEGYYIKAGQLYVTYYEEAVTGRLARPLSQGAIDRFWSYNPEHPPFFKLLYGVSWLIFNRTLGVLSEVTASRVPTAAAFGLLCALVYLFFVEAFESKRGALAAALLMLAQPRAFFHAQTASFDLPVAMLWFATVYAYWRALAQPSWRAASVTGLLFGLSLATKLQSVLLLFVLPAHWLWLAWRSRREGRPLPDARPLLLMVALGPVPMIALWPRIWHQTAARFLWYLAFHWNHEAYNFEYFGRNYNEPPYPWHEPLGMLALTAPVVLLVLAAAGIVLLTRSSSMGRDVRATRLLLMAAGCAPVVVFLRGTLPIYGETKHWLATMPFLAIAAGYAVDRLAAGLEFELGFQSRAARTLTSVAVVLTAFAPAAFETIRSHPFGLSHYNALAGGAPGGADLGMNRQFWGYSVADLLPWLNATVAPHAVVYFHDCNRDAFDLYVKARRLRSDIVYGGGIGEAGTRFVSDAAMVIHEKHFNDVDYEIWETYGHVQPAQVLDIDGVPLVSVYLRAPKR